MSSPAQPLDDAAVPSSDRPAAARIAAACGYLLAAAVTIAASLGAARFFGRLRFDALLDPDSWTRAVLLRHAIETGNFVQVLTRDASGEGTSIHWSRLLEGIALPFVLGLRPLLGLDRAIIAVGAMVGPVSLGALAAALCWAARPFVAWPPALMFTVAATATAPVLANYGSEGVFGHHIALAACLTMVFGHTARACRRAEDGAGDALCAGLWGGIATWLSVEAAPFVMVAFAALWLAWFFDDNRIAAARIERSAAAALAVVAVAWLVDRPDEGLFSVAADRLSLPYVALLLFYAAACFGICRLARASLGRRLALFAAFGAVAGGAWLALFPQFAEGLRQFMSPQVETLLWNNINEMKGAASLTEVVEAGFGGLVALAGLVAALFALRHDRRARLLLCYAALAAAAALALGIAHLRFSAYGSCLGAVAVAIIAARVNSARGPVAAAAAAAALLLFVPVYVRATAASPTSQPPPPGGSCPVSEAAQWLEDQRGVVLASINDSPELLWRSPVETVASLYQCGGAAQARWLDAARAVGDDAAAAALAAAEVDCVLLCAPQGSARSPIIADLPQTALERWQRGLPSWLQQVRADPAHGMVLLRRVR
jgi:hypothetical protein